MGLPSTWTIATAAPVAVTINGAELFFNRLTREQVGKLAAKWAASEREKYKAFLHEQHADKIIEAAKVFERLEHFDAVSDSLSYAGMYVYRPKYFDDVLRESCPTVTDAQLAAIGADKAEALVLAAWGKKDLDAVMPPEDADPKAAGQTTKT